LFEGLESVTERGQHDQDLGCGHGCLPVASIQERAEMSMRRPGVSVNKNDRIYVAGHRGLAGSAIWRRLEAEGYTDLIGATSAELDLRDRDAVFAFLREQRPDVVIDAAARVGGIQANNTYPADFLSDNLQ